MYKIFVRRTCELKAPFDICVEANNDWTHFTHLHRRTIAAFHLLYKNGNREIFLYKGRWLHPLPFYDDYVVFREDRPAQHGYRNIYVNVRSGMAHYLDAKAVSQGEKTLFISDYLFCLPTYWRWFPKFFLGIFKWIFGQRMKRIMDEDNEWIYEQMTMTKSLTPTTCAPSVPDRYDALDDLFKEDETFWMADARFECYWTENFDGKGRLRLKRKS